MTPKPDGDVKRYRYGIAIIAIAIFVMLLTAFFLPRDNGRWLFGAFAFLLTWIGAWHIDKARR